MTCFFDARGNIYGVVSPVELRRRGVELPADPHQAAQQRALWAVACAAWSVGWVNAGEVLVVMPGGTAPILLEALGGVLSRVRLFGVARRVGRV